MIFSGVIKQKFFRIAEITHLRIFGYEMGDEMRKFIGHLSWSFFGGIFSSIILLIVNISAGRILGPVEYGKYGLIVGIVGILIMPMTLGLDTASVYFIAKTKDRKEKREIISSSLYMVLTMVLIVIFPIIYFRQSLSSLFQIPSSMLVIAAFFSAVLSARILMEAFLRGLHNFKVQSIFRILETMIILMFFFTLVKFWGAHFQSYVVAVLSGYLVFILLSFLVFFRYLGESDKRISKSLLQYGTIALLGSLFGIFTMSVDKLFINKFIGNEQLGIYTAYSTVSFLLMGQLAALFVNVLFPQLSSLGSQIGLLKKVNRFAIGLFLPVWLLLSIIISLLIFIFGHRYPLDFWLVLEFGLLGTVYFYFLLLWWIINSKGERGICFTSFSGIFFGLLFVGLMYIFRGVLTINYVAIFLIISIVSSVVWANMKNK
jgi:O-antigen/teichoic acid export membrane protein